MKLIDALAPSIITLFEVYYDEIYEILLDEILENEVKFQKKLLILFKVIFLN